MSTEPRTESVVDLAGELLASQPGSAARALTRHRRRPDGRCSGCGVALVEWPCFVVSAARAAQGREADARRARRSEPT